ncbi:hypothetical protein CDL12_08556 [Handroanthus impetiginosus]|uniref:Uncharacterized protein n=1 Tax=Handroanthus impetiginosus TaxID=429701 RepID=A0A2G9HN99_9LAMI|nr:hypothetical protein CDL12_08556 [Handroanthus impetiginosus]
MASLKAVVILMFVAMISAVSAQEKAGLSPAPSPHHGAGCSLPVSVAVVGFSLLLSLLALVKN